MSKLTPWFDGKVRPSRAGVYERVCDKVPGYSYWNGRTWFALSTNAMAARNNGGLGLESIFQPSGLASFQVFKWRGLAKAPK